MSFPFFDQEIAIGDKVIGLQHKPLVIAEIGLNHNRDLTIAKQCIDQAHLNGADAVKFQSYSSEQFINRNVAEVDGLYKIFASLELDLEFFAEIKRYADQKNIILFSTPLTLDWVEKLAGLEVKAFKIASGDINNFQLLERVVKFPQPLITSTGAASLEEIMRLQAFMQLHNKKNVIFLHCVSLYPTPLEKIRLADIIFLRNHLQALVGFSDHSKGAQAALAASALGAVALEKHFTLDHNMPGPDHGISANIDEFREVAQACQSGFLMRGTSAQAFENFLGPHPEELSSDFYGKRSLYKIDDGILAMRPRQNHLPKDSDYFNLN